MKLFLTTGRRLIFAALRSGLRLQLAFFFLLLATAARAQQFPVQVTPQLVPPYSTELSEYYTGTVPKMIVTLTNTDLQQPVARVRLRMTISSQLVTLRSRDNVNYDPIELMAGLPQRLSLNDLAPYFNPNNLDIQGNIVQGRLPEGFYRFCFEAVEIATGRVVSRQECAIASLSLSDPPLLNLPGKGGAVNATQNNIVFNWTPRHLSSPNSAFTTVYNFQLVELLDNGISPEMALRTAQPLYEVTTSATSLVYGPAQPQLLEGRRYGWRVQARNTNGVDFADAFRNNGFSEVSWFHYYRPCPEPSGIWASRRNHANIYSYVDVRFEWNQDPRHTGYVVEYRNATEGNGQWQTVERSVPLTGSQPGVGAFDEPATNFVTFLRSNQAQVHAGWRNSSYVYEYRVGARCAANGPITYSGYHNVRIGGEGGSKKTTGKVTWSYKSKEEIEDATPRSLGSAEPVGGSVTELADDYAPGNTRFPLKGAIVTLKARYDYGYQSAPRVATRATAVTDENGNYELQWSYLEPYHVNFIEISHPSGLFGVIRKPLNSLGGTLEELTTTLNSFELKPTVYAPGFVTGTPVAIDVLLRENTFRQFNFISAAGVGTDPALVYYNNEAYRVMTTLTDGKTYKKLPFNRNGNEHYVARVRYTDREPYFVPLSPVEGNWAPRAYLQYYFPQVKLVKLLAQTFNLNGLKTEVAGTVRFRSALRRDVAVVITVKRVDELGKTPDMVQGMDPYLTYTTRTDGNGEYSYNQLPPLKPGTSVRIAFLDRSIRFDSLVLTRTYSDSGIIRQDVDFPNNLYTVTGRVVDQNNNGIRGALVSVVGSSESVQTSASGFYMLRVSGEGPRKLRVTLDGFADRERSFTPAPGVGPSGAGTLSSQQWVDALGRTRQVLANPQAIPGGTLTAEVFGIGTGDLQLKYKSYIPQNADLKGVVDADSTTFVMLQGHLRMEVLYKGQRIRAAVNLAHQTLAFRSGQESVAGALYEIGVPQGTYKVEVVPLPGQELFVPFYSEVSISAGDTARVTVLLSDGVVLHGTINNTATGDPVDSAQIKVRGLPYHARSDAQGAYTLVLPKDSEFELNLYKNGFNSFDTTVSTHSTVSYTSEVRLNGTTYNIVNIRTDLRLLPRDSTMPVFTSLSGFPISIDKQLADSVHSGVYLISGTLTVGDNNVFSTSPTDNSLTFKDVPVKDEDSDGNALPMADVAFEEAVMNTTAFGFVPVEVTGLPQIMLKGLKEGDEINWAHTVIGGTELTAKFREIRSVGTVPIQLRDAVLVAKDSSIVKANTEREEAGLQPFAYVYTAPDFSINALGSGQTFDLEWEADHNPSDSDYVKSALGYVSLFLERSSSELSEDGLQLNGYLQFPNFLATRLPDSGKVEIRSLVIDRSLAIKELKFDISKDRPWIWKLQKVQAQITHLELYGLGTPNMGAGFGGTMTWKKGATKGDTLFINSLSVVNSAEGLALSASVSTDVNGFGMRSLVFKTTGDESIDMSYNVASKAFEFSASGTLDYKSARTDTTASSSSGSVTSNVFPIEIQSFKLNSSDWSLFLAAKANIKIDLKIAKLHVDRLLVSVGYDKSLDAMNAYLVSGTEQGSSVGSGGPEDQIDESKSSWAVGIAGGVEFPVKNMNTDVSGSFLIANVRNKIEVRLNEIAIKVETPNMKVEAVMKVAFSGVKRGFEVEAKMETVQRVFDASLKFYYYETGGIELGASIKASTFIVTGPVQWYAIGGGFSLNTAENKYSVFLVGDVTAIGTPKEVGYVKNARIDVLFDINNCGLWPVVKGSGTLVMKEKEWGSMAITLDFCRMLMLVTIKSKVTVGETMQLNVDGVLFGIKPSSGVTGAFFMAVNAQLGSSMGDMLSGNVILGVGVNYNNNDPNAPQEARDQWGNIDISAKSDNGTRMHGFYVAGNMNSPNREGGFDFDISGLPVLSFNYSMVTTGSVKIFVRFNSGGSSTTFAVTAGVATDVEASLYVFGVGFTAEAHGSVALAGGYDGKWWVKGEAAVQLLFHNKESLSCNSADVGVNWCCCSNWHHPCCGNPIKSCFYDWSCSTEVCLPVPYFYFKLCADLKASFSYRQGESVQFTFTK
ncbi:carboxypeptidase-like regulatory domain-containing protein [Flaviaesturariibacter amylovorans]|uniref:T9SS type A sorting domain-containing protein n=1 Tax=Flaviaesturariibacter amylovorans TaxID=1084520 RepID=A0ABP8HN69_9BACT